MTKNVRCAAIPVVGDAPAVLPDPVVVLGGVPHLRQRDGGTIPLLQVPGVPLAGFDEGWRPVLRHVGFRAATILVLQGPGGDRRSWVLAPDGMRLAATPEELPDRTALALQEEARPLLARLVQDVVLPPVPVVPTDPDVVAFLQLDRPLRAALARPQCDRLLPPARVVLAAELRPADRLDRGRLRACLAVSLQERLIETTLGLPLQWPSPVDGRLLQTQGCLFLDDFRLAYRFVDDAHGLVFYLVASDHHCRAIGLYLPSAGLLVVGDAWSAHLAEVYFPAGVAAAMAAHVACWAAELAPMLAGGPARMASVMRGPPGTHLGHQLWNELGGIDTLLRQANGPAIPDWIVPCAARGTELWGRIDRLFPELVGHVARLGDQDAVTAHLYANRLCAARVTAEHVSRSLRDRLRAVVDMRPARSRLRQLRGLPATGRVVPAGLVILLGLRVENRTLTDLAGFCIRLAALIAETWPGAVLVLDGHNSRTGAMAGAGVIQSHGEAMAATAPHLVEQDVVAQVRAAMSGADIYIEDTIGMPLDRSLAWSQLADCFVSIWGASLAKYRWVCNKPGLVISSRANLLHRGDLHIYDIARTMQDPTPMLLADPLAVTDEPDAPCLVPVEPGNPFFANFHVDERIIFDQFRALVFEVLAAGVDAGFEPRRMRRRASFRIARQAG